MTKQKIDLRVGGMTCVHCADHVTQALEGVPGVERVDVPGWQSPEASVIATNEVTADTLIAAIEQAGYTATIRSRTPMESIPVETEGESDFDYDVLVIGGGSGGFAAAITASELGQTVVMVNGGTLGGTCVNVGCVPSKTLIRVAEAWHNAGHHPFKGVNTAQDHIDWPTMRAEKDALVSEMRQSKYVDVLAAYPDIILIEGWAEFQADGSVRVGERSLRARRYVIATGGRPRMLPIPGLEEAEPLNSTTLMDLEQLPKSLIILGGRAIALELGQVMARMGVEVLILQRSPRLIPNHEPVIGRAIQDYLEQEGIGVLTGVQLEKLSREGDTRIVHAKVMGQSREYKADQILMALGRQANTEGLGLDRVGVDTNEQGAIIVDEYQQTTNPRIFATGDVTTNPELVYVAASGGAVAARNAINGASERFDLRVVPQVIFTDPQIATVGLTEAAAKRGGYEVETSSINLDQVPRALAARDTRGLIKLISDATTGNLLGAHVLAAEGGEVIQTATLAVKFGLTVDDLTSTLFPYLTQVEGLKLAALGFRKDVAMLSCCAV